MSFIIHSDDDSLGANEDIVLVAEKLRGRVMQVIFVDSKGKPTGTELLVVFEEMPHPGSLLVINGKTFEVKRIDFDLVPYPHHLLSDVRVFRPHVIAIDKSFDEQ